MIYICSSLFTNLPLNLSTSVNGELQEGHRSCSSEVPFFPLPPCPRFLPEPDLLLPQFVVLVWKASDNKGRALSNILPEVNASLHGSSNFPETN